MINMSRQLILKAALILFLSAGPSAACDPEEMINELRAQCRDAITSAVALIEPLKPALAAPDRNTVDSKIKEATVLCNSDSAVPVNAGRRDACQARADASASAFRARAHACAALPADLAGRGCAGDA